MNKRTRPLGPAREKNDRRTKCRMSFEGVFRSKSAALVYGNPKEYGATLEKKEKNYLKVVHFSLSLKSESLK